MGDGRRKYVWKKKSGLDGAWDEILPSKEVFRLCIVYDVVRKRVHFCVHELLFSLFSSFGLRPRSLFVCMSM